MLCETSSFPGLDGLIGTICTFLTEAVSAKGTLVLQAAISCSCSCNHPSVPAQLLVVLCNEVD